MSEAAAAAPSAPETATNAGTEGQAAPEGGAAPQTPAERQRQRIELAKLADDDEVVMVVDGKEVPLTAAEARRQIQSAAASTKRFQEAARARREADEILHAVTSTLGDPRALYRELASAGLSPRQIADTFLQMEAEEAALTPEQRELRAMQAEREQLLEQRRQEAEQRQAAHVQRREQIFTRAFEAGLKDAGLDAAPDAVKDDVAWAFKALVEAAEDEGRKLTRSEVANALKQAARGRAGHYSSLLDEEALLARLTPELVAKYAAAQKAQTRSVVDAAPPQPRDQRSGQFVAKSNLAQDANGRQVVRGDISRLFR